MYDADGRLTSTTNNTYTDGGNDGVLAMQVAGDTVTVAETRVAGTSAITNGTAFNSLGQVDHTTDQYNAVTYMTYDARGNVIRTLYSDGTETRTSYDLLGRAEWTMDRFALTDSVASPNNTIPNGVMTVLTHTLYDSVGRTIGTERYQGAMISLTPDLTLTYAGNTRPSVLMATGPDASVLKRSGALISTTATAYDSNGRVSASTAADGSKTLTEYYPNGQVLRTRTVPSPLAAVAGASDWTTQDSDRLQVDVITLPAPIITGTTYSLSLQLNSVSSSVAVTAGSADTTASILARLAAQIDVPGSLFLASAADGYLTINAGTNRTAPFTIAPSASLQNASHVDSISTLGGIHNHWTIDALGHVTISDSNIRNVDGGGHVVSEEQRTTFDDGSFAQTLTGIAGQTIPGYVPTGTLPTGSTETVKIAQHQLGDTSVASTESLSDFSGRLTDVWQPPVLDSKPGSPTVGTIVRPHWSYAYDPNGNESSQTDPLGHMTQFTYDDHGNQLTRALPDGEQESFTYDARQRLVTHTDFNGNVATSLYEPDNDPHAGMVKEVDYVGAGGSNKPSQSVFYTYDSLGRQQTVADASGPTTNRYDAFGNLVEQETPEGTIFHSYDPATGRLTGVSTFSTDETYAYDGLGRLSSVTVSTLNGQTLATPLKTLEAYDAVGNKISETLPDGESTIYGYDDLNRLTSLSETQGSTPMFSQSFILNHDGTRKSVDETQRQADGTTLTGHTEWGYDLLDRLTSEVVTSNVSGNAFSNIFAFDLASNRVKQTHAGPGGGADEVITSTYNADDQLTQAVSSLHGTTDNVYDLNGSLTTSTNGSVVTHYTFDVRNKMVGFNGVGTTASYVYNDAGQRVAETVNGVTMLYVTDMMNPTGYAQPIEERPSANAAPSVTYLIGDHGFGQVNPTGTVNYLLTDGHGSTRLLTNSSGGVVKALNFDAFGGAIGSSFTLATAGTPFLFGGDAVYDSGSGLYLHGDGIRGRSGANFIERDIQNNGSNADPLSLHKYVYANGNPVMLGDPSGHEANNVGLLGSINIQSTGQSLTTVGIQYVQNQAVKQIVKFSLIAAFGYDIFGLGLLAGESWGIEWLDSLQQYWNSGNSSNGLSSSGAPNAAPVAIPQPNPALEAFAEDLYHVVIQEHLNPKDLVFHYTNENGALEIEQSSALKVTASYGAFPRGAYATDISPIDVGYTQRQITSMFNLPSAAWVVVLDNEDHQFTPLSVQYPHHWLDASSQNKVDVNVLIASPNPMD